MKWSKIFVRIFLLVLVLSLLFVSYVEVLKPAYNSYMSVCNPEKFEEIKEKENLVKGGETTAEYNNETEEITVEVEVFTTDRDVLKHELCHKAQVERGMIPTCDKPLSVYFAEVECYLTMNLRDSIWEDVYNMSIDENCN